MKQLLSDASNLLLSLPAGNDGIKPLPMAEIVLSAMEPIYRLVNHQLVKEPVLTDFRFTIDRKGIQSLIASLQGTESQLAKLEEHFDDTQTKLPL